MGFAELKERHRSEREGYPKNMNLRVHRALSWLRRAEQLEAQEDLDGQFIFLWIAFNATYATEVDERERESEQQTYRAFLQELTDLDAEGGRFEHLVWNEFPGGIRVLLANRFVFGGFWREQAGAAPAESWKAGFAAANRAAKKALARQDTVTVLSIVLSRIYTLRNQLLHGGATCGSSVNREQLRDCTHFMAKLVPLVIETMMDHPATPWGPGCFPVVED
jgi:hypothetical protein